MERNIFADMIERDYMTEEKRITREEFKAAVSAASDYIVNDPEVEGMAKLMVPLTGMMFAAKMEEILFGKEDG